MSRIWGVLAMIGLLGFCEAVRGGSGSPGSPASTSPTDLRETSPPALSPTAPSPTPTPEPEACAPTPPDALGPFYRPGAPVRSKVGEGFRLEGVVRSSRGCRPLPGARIEFWLAGPDGRYADAYRATVFADERGAYAFESHFPPSYGGRPPHIHIRVTAEGHRVLVTQYYPQPGQTQGQFDLVLVPAEGSP
ncbi:dioxygenase family protein [Thermoflexus hugenholtzii]